LLEKPIKFDVSAWCV